MMIFVQGIFSLNYINRHGHRIYLSRGWKIPTFPWIEFLIEKQFALQVSHYWLNVCQYYHDWFRSLKAEKVKRVTSTLLYYTKLRGNRYFSIETMLFLSGYEGVGSGSEPGYETLPDNKIRSLPINSSGRYFFIYEVKKYKNMFYLLKKYHIFVYQKALMSTFNTSFLKTGFQ